MNLEELRAEIDTIDDNLLQDFAQRMNVVGPASGRSWLTS